MDTYPAALHEDDSEVGAADKAFHGGAQALGQAADEVQGADDKLLLSGSMGGCCPFAMPAAPAGRQLHRQYPHAPVEGRLRIRLVCRPCMTVKPTMSGRRHNPAVSPLACSQKDNVCR